MRASDTTEPWFRSSTGEFPSMTLDEREEVAELARSAWPGRQIVNVSTCNISDTLRLLRHSQQTKQHLKVAIKSSPHASPKSCGSLLRLFSITLVRNVACTG